MIKFIGQKLTKLSKNERLAFVFFIQDFVELIKPLILTLLYMTGILNNSAIDISEYYKNYDWFRLVIQSIIIIVLYYVLKAYNKNKKDIEDLKNELSVSMEVSKIRIKQISSSRFNLLNTFKRDDQNDDDYRVWMRKVYDESIEKEKSELRGFLEEKFNDKPKSYIDNLMKKYYP